ncbi:MAG TPA: PTS sugar transporter subunit IIA [Candidatus Limnocylindrales bacterium]|nr:PTS sugar transporter subunit IIA [Candidatus Limnocylindrales bacterium]
MSNHRSESFLQLIRRAERGRLKVYLGYAAGVGKTYQMLREGHRLKAEGIDIVIGIVETHGRAETARLIEGLEVIPRRCVQYRGITLEEMDVEAILARKPQVVLVDELAHTNLPGSRNLKRYQDVQDILAAGIHVITTLNIQHLESLYNTIENLIGVKVKERLPDSILAEADQVVNVDLSAEDLQKRLKEGKIYPQERITMALNNFFQTSNLEQLRELTLREIASQIERKRIEIMDEERTALPDQIMVGLSSRGPNSAALLRYASRLAGRLNRNWYAVYVQTPSEDPTLLDTKTQRLLSSTLSLANQLGATVFTFKGQDVVDTLLRFAHEYRVGRVVVGRSGELPWWRRLLGQRNLVERLISQAQGLTIIVVDTQLEEDTSDTAPSLEDLENIEAKYPIASTPSSAQPSSGTLTHLLSSNRILLWKEPVFKEQVLRGLVKAIGHEETGLEEESVLELLRQREARGSTFLNEEIALPHARVEGLIKPVVALGLTHQGILHTPTPNKIKIVFLLLSPNKESSIHLQLLATAAKIFQHRELRRSLENVQSAEEALEVIQTWEYSYRISTL